MATVFSHALVGAAIVSLFPKKYRTNKSYALAALSAVVPDFDYLGFISRIPYDSLWGHRGMTHSILFALLLAAVFAIWARNKNEKTYLGFFILFFLTTISHACLDACTNGGLGVAFYSPYNTLRYFFPWRPIQVSPMGLVFFSERGLMVLASEFYWIVIPCLVVFLSRGILNKKSKA
ncbi:metal-dependent hydrolase [Pseudobdellovibrio sp. HCB154]|uniref:metal-dependent hydrolase n=1 Tax=Pseudobdellovibrio sp. HCB154 TaxID=3386277 RepID=UPI00391738EF